MAGFTATRPMFEVLITPQRSLFSDMIQSPDPEALHRSTGRFLGDPRQPSPLPTGLWSGWVQFEKAGVGAARRTVGAARAQCQEREKRKVFWHGGRPHQETATTRGAGRRVSCVGASGEVGESRVEFPTGQRGQQPSLSWSDTAQSVHRPASVVGREEPVQPLSGDG